MLTPRPDIVKFSYYMSRLVVIDYEAGNLTSVVRSLKALGVAGKVTQDPRVVKDATQLVFPGVGAAGKAMATLQRLGLDQALKDCFQAGIPILGICLGAQIILEHSEENDTPCLGLLPGRTRMLPLKPGIKIPHMGWNKVRFLRGHPVFRGLPETAEYYFVHSYYPGPSQENLVLGLTDHGLEFPSAIGRGNLVATQFHPEKSGRYGLQLLKNFLSWDGSDVE